MSLMDQQWCPTSVQVTVLQARGLRIKGKSGTNDAYAVMQVGKDKYQTSVAEKSVAPVWTEEAAFDLPPPNPSGGGGRGGGGERGTLHVHVMHRALVGPDKLLGQAVVNLLQLSEDKTRNKTEWFKLLDKTGKADKDRGEVLLDIQFMRNNMTASMFDLSAAGKSRSRLGKFKDKVRGKKKESDTVSTVVQSFPQVLTDSEEDPNGDGEVAAGKDQKKKKHKMKSLFSPKSNLQRNMSQSLSVLPANPLLSGSQSSGMNEETSEGKKKFKFMMHKRSGSSDSKDSSSDPQKHSTVEQSNLCINGSHVYCEEPQTQASRIGSNFSLISSGHGSMEDVPERQYSPWTEEEEDMAEVENIKENADKEEEEEKVGLEEERVRKQEEEFEKLAKEKRRQEDEKRQRAEEERVKREEEEKKWREEERKKQEEEESVRKEEERERLAEEKGKLVEQERRRVEEEKKQREKEEQIKMEEKRAQEERRKREEEEEERVRRVEELKLAEEKRKLEEEERKRIKEEKVRQEEEERKRREEKKAEEERGRRQEEEKLRREEECERVAEEKRKLEEQRRKIEKEKQSKLAEEKRRLEEEERKRVAEEKVKKEEEERKRREEEKAEEERRSREEEERVRRQEELEKMRLEEQEKRLQEERIRKEEERAKKEKEEYERLVEEKRKLEEERKRIEAEEKIRREEEERVRVEEERKRKEEEANRVRREEEKRRLEENKRTRIEEEEKRQREEQERIRKEEARRQEERARKEKEEYERLAEEQRRQEEQEKRQKEEEEKIRKEEMKRLAEKKRMLEEQEIRRIEEEEKIRRFEENKAERERKADEARKLEKERLTGDAEEQKKRENNSKAGHKDAGKETVATESSAEVTSTNPFDDSSAVFNVQQRCQSAVSSVEINTISNDEKDLINVQREKRPAPQPPGRNQAERPRDTDVSMRHPAQVNKQSNDKDIKTASVLPQRSVQMIAPVSRFSTDTKSTQSIMQSSTAKGTSNAVQSKRPAPPRPHSVDEEPPSEQNKILTSVGNIFAGDPEAKQVQIVYGLNPFEDDEGENEEQDEITSVNTVSICWPPAVSQSGSQTKIRSSKGAHAPPPPATTPSASQVCDPESEAKTSVHAQKSPVQENMEETGVKKKEVPPTTSRRLQPVKPLNPLEQQSVSVVQGENDNKSTGILGEVQEKTKVNGAGLKGPYSQLTPEELISLVLKQEKQLSERDIKISELEEYIDNLLVRIIEEKPSILMSMSSLKKAV